MKNRSKERCYGHAVVEVTLMAPWLFFLYVGIFDFGFYAYGAICTENAARVAVLQTSYSSDAATDRYAACVSGLPEMSSLLNMASYSTPAQIAAYCATAVTTVSDSQPVAVVVTDPAPNALDPAPPGWPVGTPRIDSEVSVTYLSIPLIPIPGLLTGRMTMTRTARMRVRE